MPWPKGRPMLPEVRAKLLAGNRKAHDSRTPEERSRRASHAAKTGWDNAPPDVLEKWRQRLAGNAATARASRKGVAAGDIAGIDHLSRGELKDYWLFRSKEFDHDEALSLVETGMLPK